MRKRFAACLLVFLLLMTGCATPPVTTACAEEQPAIATGQDLTFTDRDLAGTWDKSKAAVITGSGSDAAITGAGVTRSGDSIIIDREGVYRFTGSFEGMCVIIRAGDKDKVQLVLDNASITAASGPAILIESANKVFLTLPEGTVSRLADSAEYGDIPTDEGSSVPDAAVFSRADLTINGAGALEVTGSYKHGVASKDDLVIAGAELTVTSASTALDGKDCVKITGAMLTIEAGTNGIRSDNSEDETRGFVYVADSTLIISAHSDGIQAQTLLQAENAVMTITTINDNPVTTRSGGRSREPFGWYGDSTTSSEGSWKGLKCAGSMLISGGAYVLETADDCLHANGSLYVTGGAFTLTSDDDGIHADDTVTISGGEILITQSYEGIEGSHIIISGGAIDVTASDDGLNAAGGADGSSMGNRWGRGMFSNGVGQIDLTGGYVVINAEGDGIDSNADISVTGGVTLVSGPVSSGNAAFDYDGTATVSGGILIATGSGGMAQGFTEASNQGAMLVSFNQHQAGTSLALVDESGAVIVSFTPESTCSCAVITAPEIRQGKTYRLISGCVIEDADANGFASNAQLQGGSVIATVTMNSLNEGGGGHSMFNRPGGGRRNGW